MGSWTRTVIFILVLFSCQLPIYSRASCSSERRTQVITESQRLLNSIRANFDRKDVEPEINRFRSYVRECQLDIAHFGYGEGIFDFWLKRGYQAEANLWRSRAEYNANFRDVSEEIKKFHLFSLKAGINSDHLIDSLTALDRKGKLSFESEKRKCTQVDLRGPRLGPVRDQDSMGWCYAYVAADLLSYKTGHRISALGVAIAYDNQFRPSQKEKSFLDFILMRDTPFTPLSESTAGHILDAAQAAQTAGLCLEKDLRSEDNGYGDLYTALKTVEDVRRDLRPGMIANPSCDESFIASQSLFPNASLQDFVDIVQKSSREQLINNLANRTCSERHKTALKTAAFEADDEQQRVNLFDKVDEQLNNRNIVGVGYNSEILYNHNHEGSNANHGSVLVGRRYNKETGECEYLLRNSWGRNCGGYDKTYGCEEGNIWVSKRVLGRSMDRVEYVY